MPPVEERLVVAYRSMRRVTERAKGLRSGDLLVFDSEALVLEGFGRRRQEDVLLLAAKCPWIKEEEHFLHLTRLMGLVAEPRLAVVVKDWSVSKPLWAYRFV